MNSFYEKVIAAQRIQDEIQEERIRREEHKIITGFAAENKIEKQDRESIIRKLQVAKLLENKRQQALVITNAALAAEVRAKFDREEVEVIITNAAEPGTAYLVTNDELKKQLLASIETRGF